MSDGLSFSLEPESGLMAELPGEAAKGEARRFALGDESLRPTARLAGFERMGERMVAHIRTVIEPFARTKMQIAIEPLETRSFEDWRQDLPVFTSFSLYRMRPLKGGVLVVMEPDYIARMVDAFYGGSGVSAKPKTKAFTPTEERLLSQVTDGIVAKLVDVWAEVVPLTPALASRETNSAYAILVRADEPVVIQRFTITPATGRATTISIVYPLAALRPYEAQLGAKVHTDESPSDSDWRARMADALQAVHLPVRSVLARPELTVSQLMALKVGDVIPISLAQMVPLIVANRRIAQGTIGERDGRAALMIEQVDGDKGR